MLPRIARELLWTLAVAALNKLRPRAVPVFIVPGEPPLLVDEHMFDAWRTTTLPKVAA